MDNVAIIAIYASMRDNEIKEVSERSAKDSASNSETRHSPDLGGGEGEGNPSDCEGEFDSYLTFKHRLKDLRNGSRGERRTFRSLMLFPVINDRAEKPEVVAIGPYHRHISFNRV